MKKRDCFCQQQVINAGYIEIKLTPIEFKILVYLFEQQGKVVTSEELFEVVLQEKYLENNNTVMAHIARLREKLHELPRKPKFIKRFGK